MLKINFINIVNGQETSIFAEKNISIMENAVKNGVAGIVGECGGACSCATCHVYIDRQWLGKLDEADIMEMDMLDFAYDVAENSRLSCQIMMTDALDGIVVYIPARQA